MYYTNNSRVNTISNPKFKTKLGIVLGKIFVYLIVLYIFFIVGKAIWINWQLKKEISEIERQIVEMEVQNKNLENLILYYKSDSFREIEARKKLGLKKPGEVAIAVPVKSYDNFQQETEMEKQGVSEVPKEEETANWQLWWQYFTK